MQCAPQKNVRCQEKKQIQPTKKIWSLSKKKSNPPKNLELVKKSKSNSRKKMELLKKQVEAAKNCLRITKKFESAKTIAGACYKKKQRFAKHICHYFKSCTMVQPVMLAYIYIYIWSSFSLSSSSLYIILHLHLHSHIRCSFCPSYLVLFCRSVFAQAVAAVFDRFDRWRIMAPAGTARKLHRLEQPSNGSSS